MKDSEISPQRRPRSPSESWKSNFSLTPETFRGFGELLRRKLHHEAHEGHEGRKEDLFIFSFAS
jgi:hypothetical protein